MSGSYIYVTPFFPSPKSWRGAYCLDFVKALRRARPEMRAEVFVDGDGADYKIDGIRVWRFKEKIFKGFILPFLFRRQNEQSFLAAVERAGIDLNNVVICHGNTARFVIYPLALKKLNPQIKTLLHHHDLASFGLNLGIFHRCSLYNVFLFRHLRKFHEQIDCHVFISEASKRSFLAAPDASWAVYDDYKAQMRGPKLFRCRPVRIKESVVLHNGVDVGLFKPLNTRNIRKDFVIGCVGNFGKLKDQMTLLKAVHIIKATTKYTKYTKGEIKVVFVGSGPEREVCEAYARAKGLDVEFRNEMQHEDLPKFYHELDLFVLPSYFEGFGCVYTEAWACGVPFIACEGQGIEDVLAQENRGKWLCKPQDPNDLANKISSYMKNRYEQRLTGPIDINTLVANFISSTCPLSVLHG